MFILNLATPTRIEPINVSPHVVRVEVPDLLGLDGMESEKLTAHTVIQILVKNLCVVTGNNNRSEFSLDDWFVPLYRFDNHVHVEIDRPLSTHHSST